MIRARAAIAFVLHAHLPYVRHPEHQRSLEERWLHEATWETYLPIVAMLDRFADEGVRAPFSMSVSPTLAAMARDPLLRGRFVDHLDRLSALADRLRRAHDRNSPFLEAIAHHAHRIAEARATFDRHGGDWLGALGGHHRAGRVHLFTTAATHAHLPSVGSRAARAQVHLGRAAFHAALGLESAGFWLPECAVTPAGIAILGAERVAWTVVDAHAIALGSPRPAVATLLAPDATSPSPALVIPAWVVRANAASDGPEVACFGRDLWSRRDVWTPAGFPSHPSYREFYRDVGFDLPEAALFGEVGPRGTRIATGLKLHRVTGPGPHKAPYDPARALAQVAQDAGRFVAERRGVLPRLGRPAEPHSPVAVAAFDAELFGHFWHEGPWFLERVLRDLAENPDPVAAVTLAELAEFSSFAEETTPFPSSWGEGGDDRTWAGPHAADVVNLIQGVDHAITTALAAAGNEGGARAEAIDQAIVEWLLLQSSDFAFWRFRRTMTEYADHRIRHHHRRALDLVAIAARPHLTSADEAFVRAARAETPFLSELPRNRLHAPWTETWHVP